MTPGSVDTTTTRFFTFGTPHEPFTFKSGEKLPQVTLAYETYGDLAPDRDNAILVSHALTGSQHAADTRPGDGTGSSDRAKR